MTKVEQFEELVKGRIRPEGSISPDGKRIKRGGKWVPRKQQHAAQSSGTGKQKSPLVQRLEGETALFGPTKFENADLSFIAGDLKRGYRKILKHEKLQGYISISAFKEDEFEMVATAINLSGSISSGESLDAEERKSVEFTKSIMSPLAEETRVYRSIRGLSENTMSKLTGMERGSKIPLLAPTSTTTNHNYASWMYDEPHNSVLLDIGAPKGTDCLVWNSEEWEITVSPDYHIQVESVNQSGEIPTIKGKLVKNG